MPQMSKTPWVTIDCRYQYPRFAASFLKTCEGSSIFIENNTSRAVKVLLDTLEKTGSSSENVAWIIVTHAHLDHAGGTSELLKACPNAKVVAHPKTAKVLMEPSRLIEGAKRVYGEQEFERLYGEISPIPKEKVWVVKDGERLKWRGGTLRFLYTLGHASHHLCILEEETKSIFTGDAFGVCYPAIQGKRPFHFPSTSPVDFDFDEACKSIEKILKTGAETAYLTHFGAVTQLESRANELKTHLEFHHSLLEIAKSKNMSDEEVLRFFEQKIDAYFERCLKDCEAQKSDEVWELLKLDRKLNAAGLAHCFKKQRGQVP